MKKAMITICGLAIAILAVVPLFLRAPILGLASLVTAVSIIAIARFWKR